jgi:hypothetical protein
MEALRTQLVRSSEQLARWSQTATAHTRQLRGELTELANDIASVLAETEGPSPSHDELVRLAQDAARDPHHVNTVVALANRASDVAQALAAQNRLVSTLRRAQQRLTEMAKQG